MKNSVILIITFMFMFTGCTNAIKNVNSLMGIPNTPKEFVNKADDKYLAKVFSKYLNSKLIFPHVGKQELSISSQPIQFWDKISQANSELAISEKFENDIIVKDYKEAVLNRGNKFVVYKSKFNEYLIKRINNATLLKTQDGRKYIKYNYTPAIIEYDNNNKIISILTRYYKIAVEWGDYSNSRANIRTYAVTDIYTNYKAASAMNKIKNSEFTDNELYSSNK